MKFILKLLISLLASAILIVSAFAGITKFLFLNPVFWMNTFEKASVYPNLSTHLKAMFEENTLREGGKLKDAEIVTGVITPDNIKHTFDENIINVLEYANGRADDLIVYIPFGKVPPGLFPTDIKFKETSPFSELMTNLNVRQNIPYQNISKTGQYTNYILILGITLFLLLSFLLYYMNTKGKRLIFNGFTFLMPGTLILVLSGFGFVIKPNMSRDLAVSMDAGDRILGTVLPPVIGEVSSVLVITGGAFFLLGIILMFLRKK
jgi:hypothetical protein